MNYPRNHWYVAGFDEDLRPGQLLARTYLGENVVLFRAGDAEAIASGASNTAFMEFGDRVRMEARWRDAPVVGAIDQRVVRAEMP